MTRPVAATLLVLALLSPWAVLFGTNALRQDPVAAYRHDVCTRHCHDRGCSHAPVLPGWLTSDRGLHGATIRALYEAGEYTGLDRNTGYGLANLVVFCAAWPGLMVLLLALGLYQRVRIRDLRRRR